MVHLRFSLLNILLFFLRPMIFRKNKAELELMLKRIQMIYIDIFDGLDVPGHVFRKPTMDSKVFKCECHNYLIVNVPKLFSFLSPSTTFYYRWDFL